MKQESQQSSQHKQLSKDSLFDGNLVCVQHKPGYRFSVDSVVLAQFPKIEKNETILDLGTGCGIIGLILCYRHQSSLISITGIERQDDLAELARINIAQNGYSDRFWLVHDDLRHYRDLFKAESFSLVIANPPFYTSGSGRTSRDTQACDARHQDHFGVEGFVQAASFCVKNRGRVVFVFPAESSMHLVCLMQHARLTPKIIQYIYSYPEAETATLFVVETVKNGGTGCRIQSPFYLYKHRNGPYTERAKSLFVP